MKTTLATKLSVAAAAVGLGLLASLPAGAQTTIPAETATLTVTKAVVGTAPAGTTFTLHLTCTASAQVNGGLNGAQTDYDEDMTFGATGGSKDFIFTSFSTCEVTETNDGGADSSTGPVSVDITSPTLFAAKITNTFNAAPTTAPAAQAAAVAATPAFTG